MEEDLKSRLTSRDLWIRALYMLLFVIAYSVAELVITLIVLFQFLAVLFTGSANAALLKLGHNLSIYAYQVFQFLTFNTEVHPFPFSDWPDEPSSGSRWVDEPSPPAEPSAETTPNPDQDSPVSGGETPETETTKADAEEIRTSPENDEPPRREDEPPRG